MNNTGYASLIQFQPDAARLESANVGIVLFCPGQWLDIKMATGVGHVRKFFGSSVDADFLADMKRGLETRLRSEWKNFKTEADLAHFTHKLGNQLVMTEPRGVAITSSFELILSDLYDRWVAEPVKEKAHRSSLGRRLNTIFKNLPHQERIKKAQQIELPELDVIEVPYTYLNGRLNLVKPIALSEKCKDEARSWFLISQLLQKPNPQFKLQPHVEVVLARADNAEERDRKEYCERILHNSTAAVFSEDHLLDYEQHVYRALTHQGA